MYSNNHPATGIKDSRCFCRNMSLMSAMPIHVCFNLNDKGHRIFVVLYVDDGLVAWENSEDVERLIDDLQSEFKITTLSASNFLGLQIITLPDGSISINQAEYTKKILERFNMFECNKIATLIERDDSAGDSNNMINAHVPYREAVGCLLYLAMGTRPDIA